jgi:hypothetical protein
VCFLSSGSVVETKHRWCNPPTTEALARVANFTTILVDIIFYQIVEYYLICRESRLRLSLFIIIILSWTMPQLISQKETKLPVQVALLARRLKETEGTQHNSTKIVRRVQFVRTSARRTRRSSCHQQQTVFSIYETDNLCYWSSPMPLNTLKEWKNFIFRFFRFFLPFSSPTLQVNCFLLVVPVAFLFSCS